MALHSYALTTVQRAANYIGLGTIASGSTKETILQVLINSSTDFIERYIGMRIKQTTYTNEEYDTDAGDALILKNRPVVSVSSLQRRDSGLNEDEWETVDTEDYHVDEEAGIIYGAGGWKFSKTRQGYRVTYVAGYDFDLSTTYLSDTEAGDLELVTWFLVASAYSRGKGGAGIKSESIGDYRVTYEGSLMENSDIKSILDKYADISTGSYQTPSHY